MNRDFPLAPTLFGDKEKKVERLLSKGKKAVDEGRDRKADRLFRRAANIEDRMIRKAEKSTGLEYEPRVRRRDMRP